MLLVLHVPNWHNTIAMNSHGLPTKDRSGNISSDQCSMNADVSMWIVDFLPLLNNAFWGPFTNSETVLNGSPSVIWHCLKGGAVAEGLPLLSLNLCTPS